MRILCSTTERQENLVNWAMAVKDNHEMSDETIISLTADRLL